MRHIVKKLKEYKSKIELRDRFTYEFKLSDKIFSKKDIVFLNQSKNQYDRNVKLKWLLNEKYQTSSDSTNIDFWIINKWGGIWGFKPNEKNLKKIELFKKQLIKGRLSKDSFSTISSLSKISSFLNPNKFSIYDSRVIYTLNWLILTHENKDNLKQKYFPMPSGRNKIITDFDMKTIINISHINEFTNQQELYISDQMAYFEYCNFINKNVVEIFGNDAKPYELEMLLFILFDTKIFQEIKKRTRIVLNERI